MIINKKVSKMDLLLYFQKRICRVQGVIFELGGKFFGRMTCNIMGNNLGMVRNVNIEFTCLSDPPNCRRVEKIRIILFFFVNCLLDSFGGRGRTLACSSLGDFCNCCPQFVRRARRGGPQTQNLSPIYWFSL